MPTKKRTLKEHVREPRTRKYMVTVIVEGDMLDDDTPISKQAILDYFEMSFANPRQGIKVNGVKAVELYSK